MSGLCFIGASSSAVSHRSLSSSSLSSLCELKSTSFCIAPSFSRATFTRSPKSNSKSVLSMTAAPSSESDDDSTKAAAKQTLKVGFFFGLWYAFNVVFNIVNKKTLNIWSYPWTLSTVQLGVGSLYCTLAWLTGLRVKPNVSWGLLKAMLLPAFGHTIGHVMSCLSFSLVAISFTHIVKSAEPVFGAVMAGLVLGETYTLPVYLTLIPICVGVALSSASELTFTMAGFLTAMASNLAFALRNVFSKITMGDYKKDPTMTPANSYGLITIISFLMELPFCLLADKGIPSLISPKGIPEATVLKFVMASSLLYHLYNEVSYSALDNVSPITFSVGNTIKRVIIILTSIIVFRTKVLPLNAIGSAIAIIGTFLYSVAKAKSAEKKTE
eukprot:CAMPEP_0182445040 /NCGR_PEP_ID=MMETSP1172-20130603/3300_1 /TAXON_ID=708627 /ORGANISM="Timspurckia oligopyrenoides, Strain CCMP3278" /LENGTH=383 /DNA_ID=CAMNT_0024640737 /DNA_START=67 /DNA_END=1218 /DNA_ORIENTATION=+